MDSNETRSSFLKFFEDRGHKIVPSSPLIPHDDPTLLFINAGMNQFKNVFMGLEKRGYRTAASSQKCIRAGGKHNDLENVGFTARHHTFFEMLGNFSFGDYFKEEAILYAWEYVTKTLGLDPARLYATVYTDDDEAEKLWKKIAPQLGGRVLRFGEKDNFWAMGDTGPCGPCSEIHYDRGSSYPGELNGEGDRFMEIWNLVFMQYNRDESGNMTPLPKPSVDTGAGLERFCMILQNGESNYETDLFKNLIGRVSDLSGVEYTKDEKGVSHRVIADHVRALTFAIADGGVITNEGRGYVLRRILRRAARHGRLLGLHEPFLFEIVKPLVKLMGDQYPEIKSKKEHIELVIKSEEEQFGRTLDTGLEIFEDIVKKLESTGSKTIPGEDIFKLYDTFGFPVDLTEVMARERELQVDLEGFERELEKQRERSKKSSTFYLSPSMLNGIKRTLNIDPFVGYTTDTCRTNVLAATAFPGLQDELVLEQTPFYAESGGQVGDKGIIECDYFTLNVDDTQFVGAERVHKGSVVKGSIPTMYRGEVIAKVDSKRRADIKRNHTTTHLLHKALKMVLGEHVNQSGSLVDQDKLRFDFTHPKSMTDEEIEKVEGIVKDKIQEDLEVEWSIKPFDEAKKMGAIALFGEKYGETVRVVVTGDPSNPFSMELCGGTHVDRTSEIEDFFIIQETAIAAGMRRIEALTGRELRKYFAGQHELILKIKSFADKNVKDLSPDEISDFKNDMSKINRRLLKRNKLESLVNGFLEKIETFQKERKKLEKEKLLDDASAIEPAAKIAGGRLFVYLVPAENTDDLMVFVDRFKSLHKDSTVVTISDKNGGFAITSSDGESAREAFNIMKGAGNARGGGKPTIRGALPKDKIAMAIDGLKEMYGQD
ncbi:MAG: alanine--tRNA ligase [Candidatus Zixiibacteriota bacterium]|nr:MAG: alanine--tRNA ligase [candidate division Zixibacteria bacterium]